MELRYVPFFEVRPVISIKNMVRCITVKLVTCSINAHQKWPTYARENWPICWSAHEIDPTGAFLFTRWGIQTPVPVNLNNLTSRKSWHRDEVCFSLRFFLIVPELNKPGCNSRFQKNNMFSGVLVSIKTKVECRKLVPQNHGKEILCLKKYFFKK